MSLAHVRQISLPKILDERGNLSFFENYNQLPFAISRVYLIYDVPGGEVRGGHAYHTLQEVIVALSGSFDIVLHDGNEERKYTLNRSYFGLYIPKMIWRHFENFSTNSLALIAADQPYNETDYVRNFDQFLEQKTMTAPTVFDCSLITLPRIQNRAGNITPVHNSVDVPFDIKRVFYLFDVPGGESRGAHAHKQCHQFLIAASGSFEVLLNDGKVQRLIQLNRPYIGLHVPPLIWASEINFSSGAICLVLASHEYTPEDYIREYNDFLNLRHGKI